MVILEYPTEFGLLPDWLAESGHPVLENDCSRELVGQGLCLNLVQEREAAQRINAGERVYTCTETALDWIAAHTSAKELVRMIETCKDKSALRRCMHDIDPSFFFRECTAAELTEIDYSTLPSHFIIKPNRGFCSVGVFVVENEDDWNRALNDIAEGTVHSAYAQSVIDDTTYIIEEFITGTEYAIDAYFDDEGAPHVLNVLRHDFASEEDTSDRLYITSPKIIDEMAPRFESWLSRINEKLCFANFCMHAEVRVQDDAIRAIEFNPLRFAGVGGTDISHYAYGFYSYAAYLENRVPNWNESPAGTDDVFAMSFVMAEPDAGPDSQFDLEAFCAPLEHVLEARKLDTAATGAWTFVFAKATTQTASSLNHLMTANLRDYVIKPRV